MKLAEAFIDIGTRNRGNTEAYYQELNDWVRTWDGNSGQLVVEHNRDGKNEGKAEGNGDITLSPTFEDDLTYPNLPDSSPARSEASGVTFGRLVTPGRTEGWLGSNSRAQSLPMAGNISPSTRSGRSQSHPVGLGQLPGQFTGDQRPAPIGHPPVGGVAGLSPLKEVEEPLDDEPERETRTRKRAELVSDDENEKREDKGSGLAGDDDDEGEGEDEVDEIASGDEDEAEEDEDELDDEAPGLLSGQRSSFSDPGTDRDEPAPAPVPKPVPEPETSTKKDTSKKGRKRKADDVEIDRGDVEKTERVVLTRSGRKIRLIKSSAYIQDSDEEDHQPPPRSSRPRQPPAARPDQGSSRNHKRNKDPKLKRLAPTPCGRCAHGNRICMIFVNKPTVRACATCNGSHTACDFVGSWPRARRGCRSNRGSPSCSRSRSRSRSRSGSSSRSPSRGTEKLRKSVQHREDISMEVDELESGMKSGKRDPYSAEELAKRRKGKSRNTGNDTKAQKHMKRSPSLPTRPPFKRVKIEGTSCIMFTHSIVFKYYCRPSGHVSRLAIE